MENIMTMRVHELEYFIHELWPLIVSLAGRRERILLNKFIAPEGFVINVLKLYG